MIWSGTSQILGVTKRSVWKCDVGRGHVQQIDAKFLKLVQNRLNPGPAPFELFALLRFPVRPNLLRKIGTFVEVSAGEIKDVGAFDDRYFDDTQFVIVAEELRHIEVQYCLNGCISEPLIDAFLPAVCL